MKNLFSKIIVSGITILSIIPTLSFTAFAETSYKDSEITVFDKNTTWSDNTQIDLFERNELGNQLVYPGVTGQYTFTVRNKSVNDRECEVVISDTNDFNIPLDIKIKKDNSYVIGNENDWEKSANYDSGIYKINANSDNVYTLEWKWDFYTSDDNDKIDTELGKQARYKAEPYILQIKAYGETELIEISEPDPIPVDISDPEPNPPESSTPESSDPESSNPKQTITVPPDYDDNPTQTGDTTKNIFFIILGISAISLITIIICNKVQNKKLK